MCSGGSLYERFKFNEAINSNEDKSSKLVYESFNLKANYTQKNRISHLIFIPINGLLESDTKCEFYNDIVDFFNQTLIGLNKLYTKSRVFAYPIFLNLDKEGYEIYNLENILELLKNETQLSLTIHVIAHGEPTNFDLIDVGVDSISCIDLGKQMSNILDKIGWGSKEITFHFHTCDSASTRKKNSHTIVEHTFICKFWNILNKKGYKITTIGYPGLYRSLKGGSGNAVVEFKGMTFERSKAEIKIETNGNVIIPDLKQSRSGTRNLSSGNVGK